MYSKTLLHFTTIRNSSKSTEKAINEVITDRPTDIVNYSHVHATKNVLVVFLGPCLATSQMDEETPR